MNSLQAFIARLSANKFLAGTGGLIILATIVVTFPKSVSFLPEDLAKQVWNLAHDYIGFAIGGALLFVKGHASVGDPVKPDVATFNDQKDAAGDWRANAAGKDQP